MVPQGQVGVRTTFDVPATMRDGTVLRANIYQPDDGGSGTYPVLLTRLPYGKDFPLGSSVLNPEQAARRGYIVVVQDVRGCFTSEGEWFPLIHEGRDGFDTVAWASTLPGANGMVGMYGASYFGYTQWAAANQNPPALRAIAPMLTWADSEEGVTSRSGVLELGLQANWILEQGIDQLSRRHRGDLAAFGGAVHGLARELDNLAVSGYAELPLEHFGPLARLNLSESFDAVVQRQTQEELMRLARATGAYARTDLPALHIAGWYDVFLQGTLRNFLGMQASGNTKQRLVIGPWTHGNFSRVLGDVDFGYASAGALIDLQIDIMSLQLQFFDRWLKGVENGSDGASAVKYFLMGANVWKTSDTWPPRGVVEERWYLHSQGHANTAAGDGRLSRELPASEPPDSYTYDPANPVPTIGGATLLHPAFRSGPRDQRPLERRTDMLVYTSEPLERPLEVTGPVRVALYVASDAPDTDFVARLVDVYPGGAAITLTDGITRMRFRHGTETEAGPLDPAQLYEITVDLWSTSVMFLPGHRIRVDVTSSSFPRWERNLNTGANNGATTEMRVARQSLAHDAGHPAHVVLPVLRG